jgi:hypothetical protein
MQLFFNKRMNPRSKLRGIGGMGTTIMPLTLPSPSKGRGYHANKLQAINRFQGEMQCALMNNIEHSFALLIRAQCVDKVSI